MAGTRLLFLSLHCQPERLKNAFIKYKKIKKNKFYSRLKIREKNNKDMENIDKLITHLKREYIKIVK